MKWTLLFLFVFFLLLAPMTMMAQANSDGLNFTGGVAYSTLEVDKWNDYIDQSNQNLSEIASEANADLDKMDNIDQILVYYFGVEKWINDKIKVGGRFEHIPGEIDYKISEGVGNGSIEVELQGYILNMGYKLNDSWNLTGALGWYDGDKTHNHEGVLTTDPYNLPEKETFDVEGNSQKLGLEYDKDWRGNWSFTAKASYRWMTVEDKNPETGEDREQDNNGIELNAGLSYAF
ncbi:MAG: autotransporter domain-containing protein [Bacillota bacterium]